MIWHPLSYAPHPGPELSQSMGKTLVARIHERTYRTEVQD
jgi:hypothetical protein